MNICVRVHTQTHEELHLFQIHFQSQSHHHSFTPLGGHRVLVVFHLLVTVAVSLGDLLGRRGDLVRLRTGTGRARGAEGEGFQWRWLQRRF